MSASGGVAGLVGTQTTNRGQGANVQLVVALAAVAGETNYITGFEVTGGGATAAGIIDCVLSGCSPLALHYDVAIPAGATLGIQPLIVTFNPPLQATAPNQAITLTVPAFGAGNTNASVNVRGYVA